MDGVARIRHTLAGAWLRSAAVLLVACWVADAGSDVRPPVEFQIDGPVRAAEAGQAFRGTLVVRALRPVRLDTLRLQGDGWRITRFRTPAPRKLWPTSPLRVPFTAIPTDPRRPLVIRAVIERSSMEKWLDLSPEAAARANRPGSVRSNPNRRSIRRGWSCRPAPP